MIKKLKIVEEDNVFIGLGSNLSNPIEQLEKAILEVKKSSKINFLKTSSLYTTNPMGPSNQPNFINAVIKIKTELSPSQLLKFLKEIEKKHLRKPSGYWGPRTLDLDILLFGDKVVKSRDLMIPHPFMHERIFVLKPLLEIAPKVKIPGMGEAKKYLKNCKDLNIKINKNWKPEKREKCE